MTTGRYIFSFQIQNDEYAFGSKWCFIKHHTEKRRISHGTRIFVAVYKNLNQRWNVQNKQTTRIILHSRIGCTNEKFPILFHCVAVYLFPRIDAACTSAIRVYCQQESVRNTFRNPEMPRTRFHGQ